MRRSIVVGTVLGLALLLAATPAMACTCISYPMTWRNPFAIADIVFRGQQESIVLGIRTFRVEERYKGWIPGTVQVTFDPLCGMLPVSDGALVVISAVRGKNGRFFVPPCYRGVSKEVAEAYRRTIDSLDRTIAAAPSTVAPMMEKARFLAETHSKEDLLLLTADILGAAPDNVEALHLRGLALDNMARNEEALATLAAAARLSPDPKPAMRSRVALLLRLGRVDEVPEDWRDFDGMTAFKASFAGRRLDGATFRNAKLQDVAFFDADLRGADFSGVFIFGAWFGGAAMSGVRFRGANAYSASFAAADLTGADLTGTRFRGRTIWPDGFDPIAAGAVLER